MTKVTNNRHIESVDTADDNDNVQFTDKQIK